MADKVGRWTEVNGLNIRLRQVFSESGLTCQEIARRCGVSPKCIYKYWYNQSSPSVQNLARICSVLNVSADYLLFGKK